MLKIKHVIISVIILNCIMAQPFLFCGQGGSTLAQTVDKETYDYGLFRAARGRQIGPCVLCGGKKCLEDKRVYDDPEKKYIFPTVGEILKEHPEINDLSFIRNETGQSLLHVAIYWMNFDAVEGLLNDYKGIDLINIPDSFGQTPLCEFVKRAPVILSLHCEDFVSRFVCLFLSKGADCSIRNNDGLKPLDIAERLNCKKKQGDIVSTGEFDFLIEKLENAESKKKD